MQVVNIHDAKTHFSALLTRVAAGEEIIISRAGKPVARLQQLAVHSPEKQVVGGGFRLQEKIPYTLTPKKLNEIAETRYDKYAI